LRQEILALAAAIDPERLWIEKVRLGTTAVDDGEAIKARADALADLQDLLQAAESDAEFLSSLHEDFLGLVNKMPLDLQAMFPYFSTLRAGDLASVVSDVRPGLIAYLANKE
jgi:hypothetical protein